MMKEKALNNINRRKCISCNKIGPKEEFIRIVKNKNGLINIDLSKKAEGRGAYICINEQCLNKMIKQKKT